MTDLTEAKLAELERLHGAFARLGLLDGMTAIYRMMDDLPALIAEVRALQAEVERLRKERGALNDFMRGQPKPLLDSVKNEGFRAGLEVGVEALREFGVTNPDDASAALRAIMGAVRGMDEPRPMSDAPRDGTHILARWPATQHGQERTGWVTTWCDGDRWWTPWTMAFVDAPGGPDAWRDHPRGAE